MRKLVAVIGPAPSELSFEQLVEKLRKERERISNLLARTVPKGSKRAVAKGLPRKKRAKKPSKHQALLDRFALMEAKIKEKSNGKLSNISNS